MPPKPQVFKTPDGKEFSTRAEWRDYMMLTFYSFKNKVNEPEPLIKKPGDIDGQMFDIADCENSTLVIMDYCEQVQIDQVKNCRIFIGACASSIFIRNCENCVFYTACRQLRLREVVNSNFYIYSMAEVHIEYSNGLKFAPFNGGYPEHGRHMTSARLELGHNLWYDIFDHNDPAKTHANWSLLPESEYEPAWFPAGEPCEMAVPRVKVGSVQKVGEDNSMQSFSFQQLVTDAQNLSISAPAQTLPPVPASVVPPAAPVAAPAPVAEVTLLPPPPPAAVETATPAAEKPATVTMQDTITEISKRFANYRVGDETDGFTPDFTIDLSGEVIPLDVFAVVSPLSEFEAMESIEIAADNTSAVSNFSFSLTDGSLVKAKAQLVHSNGSWKLSKVALSE